MNSPDIQAVCFGFGDRCPDGAALCWTDRDLWATYSPWLKELAEVRPDLFEEIIGHRRARTAGVFATAGEQDEEGHPLETTRSGCREAEPGDGRA